MQQNDSELTTLSIRDDGIVCPFASGGGFYSIDDNDFSQLGFAIGFDNTHLESLSVLVDNDEPNRELLDGLRRNTSISELNINCYDSPIIGGGLIHEVLKVYKEKQILTEINITRARLVQNREEEIITTTIRNCLNIKRIRIDYCNMPDALFSQMFDAMVPLSKLKTVCFGEHRIGNAVCISIANLLANTKSLNHLSIKGNRIDTEGARIITNSLSNNTTLQNLYIKGGNPYDQNIINGILSTVLCNTTSINDTYLSNHTLKQVDHKVHTNTMVGEQLAGLLNINNEGSNTSQIAIEKILKHHPNIDMEPLFELDAEEGERNLKALPYVVDWFGRAKLADVRGKYNVEQRKLSAIHQFAKAMPLLFEGIKAIELDDKKRKRDDDGL